MDQKWTTLADEFDALCELHPRLEKTNNRKHLGTLGTGNHFVEVCLDEVGFVWFMLHSGSRGVGNAIGNHFIELAKKDAELHQRNLPDKDLAYFEEGARYFGDYVRAVSWAQKFAMSNREVMMANLIATVRKVIAKPFEAHVEAVNCHHNYVQKEHHFGEDVFVTRKGAVSARRGEMGIIPGSMGARSYIVRGLGNPESFESCSHGAGRVMSRTKAKKLYSVADQIKATEGVECRKDEGVIDEIPMAYKDIDAVMAAQKDLVEVVHTLKQVICVRVSNAAGAWVLAACQRARTIMQTVEQEFKLQESVLSAHPVSDAMRSAVQAQLEAIEQKHDVTMLFACESGSRGWALPRPTATTTYALSMCTACPGICAPRPAAT